jgi:hypothetical protein
MATRKAVWKKKLEGSIRPDRERARMLRETRHAETFEFVVVLVHWFMNDDIRPEHLWIASALERDVNQLATRLWRVYEKDFKAEYRKRHPGEREPNFWRRFKGLSHI